MEENGSLHFQNPLKPMAPIPKKCKEPVGKPCSKTSKTT